MTADVNVAEKVARALADRAWGSGREFAEDVRDAMHAALADPEVLAGIAGVLRKHETSLVTCAGRIAGYVCTCGMASDHGWSEAGARECARLHVSAEIVEWLTGGAQ